MPGAMALPAIGIPIAGARAEPGPRNRDSDVTVSVSLPSATRPAALYHPSGYAFTYAHDALGRLSSVAGGIGASATLAQFTYNVQGLPATRADVPGSGVAYSYDAIGRPTGLTDTFTGGTGNVTLGFGYNQAGQIASLSRSKEKKGTVTVTVPFSSAGARADRVADRGVGAGRADRLGAAVDGRDQSVQHQRAFCVRAPDLDRRRGALGAVDLEQAGGRLDAVRAGRGDDAADPHPDPPRAGRLHAGGVEKGLDPLVRAEALPIGRCRRRLRLGQRQREDEGRAHKRAIKAKPPTRAARKSQLTRVRRFSMKACTGAP